MKKLDETNNEKRAQIRRGDEAFQGDIASKYRSPIRYVEGKSHSREACIIHGPAKAPSFGLLHSFGLLCYFGLPYSLEPLRSFEPPCSFELFCSFEPPHSFAGPILSVWVLDRKQRSIVVELGLIDSLC